VTMTGVGDHDPAKVFIPGVGEVDPEDLRDLADDLSPEGTRDIVIPLGMDAPLAIAHRVYHPDEIGFAAGPQRDEYCRLYPYFWHACDYPDRPVDEAMLIEDEKCPACAVEWKRRGLPLDGLPPLPPGAPRLRDL